MTNITTEIPAARPKAKRMHRAEFTVYFAIIFAMALPLATVAWALASLRRGALAERGPIARAWTQARIITPMIFSA